MYSKIGSLRDLHLAKEIMAKLEAEGLSCRIAPDPDIEDLFLIEVSPLEKAPYARVLFARSLGLIPKYDFEMGRSSSPRNNMGPVTKILLYTS
ncbi:MAG: hypothetical protein AABY86_11440, partial [Bdellovibrionota bacterium]